MPATLHPDDLLHLPLHQRTVAQYGEDEQGQRELHLFYADKEISFDEPELFVFGETLARQSRFTAADALGWGRPGDWPRVRGLLEQLIDAGVLQRGDGRPDPAPRGDAAQCPSPLPPALTDTPRSWHECPRLMAELTGRPLDIGYLELVVPIFRVAHMALDAEARQVGESNAFPPALRLDVPTRWRTCIYAGSRFQDPKPMNVSALKAMRAHWGPTMAMLLKVREAYLARCPEARAGWTVGHLERLSTAVLALPAWQLMRSERRVHDGELHPVLSSMFRVTDGLRMTMHHMLFIPFGEPTRRPDTPMSAAEVHAYAERSFSFHSEHGVCAGPKAMIDEFLSVIIDGQAPHDGLPATLDDELQQAVADIEPALDYAMLGLKAYAAVFSLWPMTMRCYEQLAAIVDTWAAEEPGFEVHELQHWLRPIVERLRSGTHLATEAWRADRELVYGDMFAQSERTLSGRLPAVPLATLLAPTALARDAAVRRDWQAALARRFGASRHAARLQEALLDYVLRTQAVVRLACHVQHQTNRLLGRAAPKQRFTAAHIDLYVQLAGQTEGRVPFLLDELEQRLGLRVEIDAQTLAIVEMKEPAPA